MRIGRTGLVAFVLMVFAGSLYAAGVGMLKQKRALPLDGLPGVIMKTPENSQYLPDRIIVKVSEPLSLAKGAVSFGLPALDYLMRRYSVQSIDRIFPENYGSGTGIDFSRFYVVKYSSPLDAFNIAREISDVQGVEYADPWFIYPADDSYSCKPDDPNWNLQWGMTKILADSAFCVNSGDTTVVIGIVDTGVQWDHPDLEANIWINPGEWGPDGQGGFKQNNRIDDDGDGFIDDWHGWDFGGGDYNHIVEDNNPSPINTSSSHGTHVAGIASAVTNNSVGIAGTGYHCKILPVKASSDNDMRASGTPYIIFGFDGIVYAAAMGAKVINCSWGGPGASQFEQEIIDSVTAHGTLVVAAAGNTGTSQIGYPASYRGVISVAATVTSDAKAGYSTYNEFVDVSAPGDNIWSTYYRNTYTISSGTSMASPMVAGLAGLVKSQFPSYNALQVGEQVRISCDSINAQNPSYRNLIGKGRINAYRALTFSSPSLRMNSFIIKDSAGGNNNGIPEANENFTIIARFTNYLQPTTSQAMVTISTSDTNVQVQSGSYPVGAVGTLGTTDNSGSPFQVHVKSNPPPGLKVMFSLTITDAGYSDYQMFSIMINPIYATHNVNNVEVTLTNISRIGFVDLSGSFGSGFVFGGGNQLFEGGLMLGTSATKTNDVVRNGACPACQDNDFSSSGIYALSTPGVISQQDGRAVFTDNGAQADNKIGLQISMYSYAFTGPSDSNYIILRYDIKNTSVSTVSNLYAGLFFDWDMLPDYSTNKTSFDASRGLGYAWDNAATNPVYCGAGVLEGNAGFRGIINNAGLDVGRAAKWSWLSGGVVTNDSVGDIHMTISSGPYTIPSGDKKMVAFAILGGKDLTSLQSDADAARVKWSYVKSLIGSGATGMISGMKFNDINHNGARDSGEPGISNWRIYLSGKAKDSTLTDSNGQYRFFSRDSGDYVISEETRNNWAQSSPAGRTYSIYLALNDTATGKDFGNYQLSSLTIRKYSDGDGDINTTGDFIAHKWNLSLYRDSVSAATLLNSVQSDSILYAINLIPGIYIAAESDSTGWRNIGKIVDGAVLPGSSNADTVTLAAGETRNVDFVNFRPRIEAYSLRQNYPNPFNPGTTISYDIPRTSRVVLRIYDVLGRVTKTIVDAEQPAGRYAIRIDGSGLASGVYLYKLVASPVSGGGDTFSDVKKFILVK